MNGGHGRAYVVPFVAVSVTAPQDFIYIKPAADKICFIEAGYVAASGGAADAGDAQEELLDIELVYLPATVTVGSGGTSVTPAPLSVNDAAAGFTARANDTTKATSSGTAIVRHPDGMNSRIPWVYSPPSEHDDVVANAAAIVLRLNTTPADAILMSGKLVVRELP
jgi:hypothetical protein